MMLLLLLFGLVLGAASSTEKPSMKLLHGACPMFWNSFNGRCYKYVATAMNWADAELHCVSQGANLVSVHSQEEHSFVNHLIRNFDPAQKPTWIGLSDIHKDRTWMWSDGSRVNYEIWDDGEPNNAGGREPCVQTNWGNGKKWNDSRCRNQMASVCKLRTHTD